MCSTKAVLEEHCREACWDTQTSIRLASHLVRVPNSRSGGHEFESPIQREFSARTKSGKTLGVRSFYSILDKLNSLTQINVPCFAGSWEYFACSKFKIWIIFPQLSAMLCTVHCRQRHLNKYYLKIMLVNETKSLQCMKCPIRLS